MSRSLRVARQYAGRDVQFIGVLYDDTPANGVRWIDRRGGQAYPAVDDPRKEAAIAYGLFGVPETFIIDRQGKVAMKHAGPITERLLSRALDSLLAQ